MVDDADVAALVGQRWFRVDRSLEDLSQIGSVDVSGYPDEPRLVRSVYLFRWLELVEA